MIGEGGFGGVYRGVIRSMEDSSKKIDIAVKQLGRRGLQASFPFFLHAWLLHIILKSTFTVWGASP
jgi:hypothetical protein